MNRVSEPHQLKPDPSEPWRYVCVKCGSTSLRLCRGGQAIPDQEPTHGVHKCREPYVRCRVCTQQRRKVTDKKASKDVSVGDVI